MTKQFSSVWTREPRQPKAAGLRREQIVATALEVLDAEGLGALSMRKLGAKLDAGATSLYWHVANKDELLELTLDEIWGLVHIPDPDRTSWREVATTFAYNFRRTMLDHPWVATLIGSMPSVGPKAFELSDRLRRTFISAGFSGIDVYLASGTVMSYVLGQVIPEIAAEKVFGDKGLDAKMVLDAMDTLAADYPEMLADYRETLPTEPRTARAMAFDFGLLCMLDGLESRLRK
ncbi:TetR/AcrR family transcriptional regulator C-terminal domain-containing protein [Nocardia sp. NPDC052112]|uniref:TetR/AcrR family transcriptional regulator C-terminal domain-containing protein n=1 Tax=Nocardia sp. NPDC052112 TaxID=3155646 RepID=UPI0034308411